MICSFLSWPVGVAAIDVGHDLDNRVGVSLCTESFHILAMSRACGLMNCWQVRPELQAENVLHVCYRYCSYTQTTKVASSHIHGECMFGGSRCWRAFALHACLYLGFLLTTSEGKSLHSSRCFTAHDHQLFRSRFTVFRWLFCWAMHLDLVLGQRVENGIVVHWKDFV